MLLSFLLFVTGWNIRKLQTMDVHLQNMGMMDLLKVKQSSVITVSIENPSMIPLSIQPFSLLVTGADGKRKAHLNSNRKTTLQMFSHHEIPLTIYFEPGVQLPDLLKLCIKGIVIEGNVTVTAFGISRSKQIRKVYAMPKLF
jgi:hypothetical protein